MYHKKNSMGVCLKNKKYSHKSIKKGRNAVLMLLIACFVPSLVFAAPFEIEGYIKEVRAIEVKPPYTFDNKPIVSIYIVGHRFGKDFDYQYMVVQDSTQLEGISFSDLKVGKYVRVKSRAEPPGMLGKPIQEIRASRYGCCNYAFHIDTISTPRKISAIVTRIDSHGPTDIVVTVSENKAGAQEFQYLIVKGKTTIDNGTFSDIKVASKIEISGAGINIPVAQGVDHGKLYGADLYAAFVNILK
jgi:hypothetical protein